MPESTVPVVLVAEARPSVVDAAARTISGLIAPYGEVGSTSAGRTRFLAGSLRWSEPKRVSLNREHVRADALGVGVQLVDGEDGLSAAFRVDEGPSGDRALVEAHSTRSGLSVELDDITAAHDRDGVLVVSSARVRAVAQVSVPAFDSARITAIAASLAAPTPSTDSSSPTPSEDPVPELAPAAAPTTPPAAPAAPAPATVEANLGGPAFVPAPSAAPSGPRAIGLDQLAASFAAFANGGPMSDELRAALSDIVPANGGEAFFRPAYADELWDEAADVQRPFIDAITTKPLTGGLKVKAFRWVTKPGVADYAGDKAAVASGPASLEPVEVSVERTAGAHDIDRAYLDLGTADFVAAYFTAMTESYRELTEAKVVAHALANATHVADANGATAGEVATALDGLVAGSLELLGNGKYPSFAAIGSGLLADLFGISAMEAPAFFGGSLSLANATDGRIGELRIFPSPNVPARSMLVGTKRSVTFWEKSPPIRVQALNIANGGVDAGVFGYHAQTITDRRGIRRVDVA